jgi:UDP-N-acetylglucosamine--N-acetylmuramyl-(pentapeptide) pyrophosphoryl-undecaprenol N-acetylglucosamine transferase
MQNKQKLNKRILITGGGSGGHVSAAESIISEIEKHYEINNRNFLYVGGDLGMVKEKPGNSVEQRRFKDANFKTEYIRAGKLQRSLNLDSIYKLLRTGLGFLDSYRILRKYKPEVTISTGGFVSVPVCIIAKLFKSKIYLHEQTATVGLANKIVGKFADKIFLAFDSSKMYFPNKTTVHTGNLVRPEIFNTTGEGEIIKPLNKMIESQEKYPIIYMSGGSLGSHLLNDTVRTALCTLLEDFQVILQTGDNQTLKDYDLLKNKWKSLDDRLRTRFHVTKFVQKDEIGVLLNNIDLFVGRAGANTVYEMGTLQIPSIFIPIPWVTHNEQQKNAEVLKELGLSEIITEGELSPEQLIVKIKSFYKQNKKINEKELKKKFPRNAAERILKELNI